MPESVTLEWDCTDPDNDNLTLCSISGSEADGRDHQQEIALNDLARGTTYYWSKRMDSSGAKTEGPINSFNSIANISPRLIQPRSIAQRNRSSRICGPWFCEDPDMLRYKDVFYDTEPFIDSYIVIKPP